LEQFYFTIGWRLWIEILNTPMVQCVNIEFRRRHKRGKPLHKFDSLLRWGQPYVDEGAVAYEKRYNEGRIKALMAKANQLGYKLTPATW
jgi:hypothetical protein